MKIFKLLQQLQSYSKLIISILSLLVTVEQAWSFNRYKLFDEGRTDLMANLDYMKSDANYKLSGDTQSLVGNNYYQLLDTSLGGRYVWNNYLATYAFVNIGSAESKGVDSTRTNSTLNKAWVGTEMMLDMGLIDLIPEVSILVPFEKVSTNQDVVLNNEGANEFTGKMNVQLDFKSFLMFGYLGFTYRDGGRSYLMPWGANAEYHFSKIGLGAEIFGFQSISGDQDKGATGEVNREILASRVNGGSKKFYSVEPSVVDFNLYVIMDINKSFSMGAGGGLTLAGANYASGYHAGAFLQYSFGGSNAYKPKHKNYRRTRYDSLSTDKQIEKFNEDTKDGVDQKLFQPQPSVAPKPRQTVPADTEKDQELKQQLMDTEMSIELKSRKKKRKR